MHEIVRWFVHWYTAHNLWKKKNYICFFIGLVRQEPFYWCQHPNSVCCRPTVFMRSLELASVEDKTSQQERPAVQTCSCGVEERRKISVNIHTTHTSHAQVCFFIFVGTFHGLFFSTVLFTLANYFQGFLFVELLLFLYIYNLFTCSFVIYYI